MESRRVKLVSLKRFGALAFFVLIALLAVFPRPAEAHLNSTGLGPVYDGILHFLTTPEDILSVLALALFAGLRGAAFGRRALFVLPAAWLVGGFIGLGRPALGSTALACVSFLLLGGLLAANAKISLRFMTALSFLVGLSHGFFNGAGIGTTENPAVALLGLAVAVFVFTAIMASIVVPLHRQWTHIAVRVIGSWIVATGILMAGWAARKS